MNDMRNNLIQKIAEARRLGLTGEALMVFIGVKLAGIDDKIVYANGIKASKL